MTKGFRDTPHDVFHAWNGNTVAQGTVACGVGSARHIRPAIRIALEAFTFDWNKPSNQKRLFQNYVCGVFALPGTLGPRGIGLPKRIGSGAGKDLPGRSRLWLRHQAEIVAAGPRPGRESGGNGEGAPVPGVDPVIFIESPALRAAPEAGGRAPGTGVSRRYFRNIP